MTLFSIVIPTYNPGRGLEKLIKRLMALTSDYSVEILVIDSQSTDGSPQLVESLLQKFPLIRFYPIKKKDFNHGLTRNMAAGLARGKFVCFISQDALPRSQNSFKYFLEDFRKHKEAVAVFTKDVPYNDTPIIQKLELICRYEQFDRYAKGGILVQNPKKPFAPISDETEYVWYGLSNVFSCFRGSFLSKHPFDKADYGEDLLMGKKIIKMGLSKIYDPRCRVTHSHKYGLIDYYRRQKEDFGLRLNKLRFKERPRLICKLTKIGQMKVSAAQKLFYIGQLLFYYLLKTTVLVEIKLLGP